MATADRDYIISRIRTKAMTADQFEYEKLSCPYTLSQLFSYDDIWRLYELADSPKYSGKPREKIKKINEIMVSRGFEKLQGGTNRICYRFIEDSSFVVKVAVDSGGLKDNPAEFINQRYLAPFCTKVFECAPNGVLASFERVKAIKNRQEYYTIHADVFRLIKEFIIPSGYIMEDIGTEYFMNVGVRQGFGPVLLDFSFLYITDAKKLYCTKPDINSYTGLCEGEIDYDPGYNFLYCTRCGTKYKAVELAKRVEGNTTKIRRSKRIGGRKIMKMTFNGGDKNCKNEQVTSNNGGNFANSIPKMVVKPTEGGVRRDPNKEKSVKVFIKDSKSTEEVKKEESVEVKEEIKQEKVEEVKETVVVAEAPKTIEELVIKEKVAEAEETTNTTAVIDKSDAESPVEFVTVDSFKEKLNTIMYEFSYLNGVAHDDSIIEIFKDFITEIAEDPAAKTAIVNALGIEEKKATEDEDYDDYMIDESYNPDESEAANDVVEEVEEESTSTVVYDSDVSRFEAVVVNLHDVIDSAEPEDVLLIKNVDDDSYVTVGDNQLFVVDMIDGAFISSLAITSKDYLDDLEAEVKKFEENAGLIAKEAPTGA